MKVSAIVPSAGSGRRMKSKIDKLFIRLMQKEIICYCLKVLDKSSLISEIIVTCDFKNISKLKKLIKKEGFKKRIKIVKGGKVRPESVLKGLSEVSADSDIVLIHDCARPFITQSIIKDTVKAARVYGASLSAVLVKPTIKLSSGNSSLVKKTIDRTFLWEAQTPQVIKKDLLIKAYKKAGRDIKSFTDDCSLVEKLGKKVKIVNGSYDNIKITTPQDLYIAEAILKSLPTGRQGKRNVKNRNRI